MYKKTHISDAVIKRLPKYYRYLCHLLQNGEHKISSKALAEALNVTASQVRQDFSNFGEFGQQGYGYDIYKLTMEISQILNLHADYNVIVIGAGNIGNALAHYTGFKKDGFNIKAMFDLYPENIDAPEKCKALHVDNLEEYCSENHVDIAIIATKKEAAEQIYERVCNIGIRGVWNFVPVDLMSTENTVVENINMSDSLFVLSYYMQNHK